MAAVIAGVGITSIMLGLATMVGAVCSENNTRGHKLALWSGWLVGGGWTVGFIGVALT